MARRDISVIILFNENKDILLQHRAEDAKRLPGYWAFFGGGIEMHESAIAAVKREALEELSYHLDNPKEVMVQDFGDENQGGIKHVFVEKYDPSIKLELQEGQGMKWVTIAETKSMKIVDHDKKVLAYIKDKY